LTAITLKNPIPQQHSSQVNQAHANYTSRTSKIISAVSREILFALPFISLGIALHFASPKVELSTTDDSGSFTYYKRYFKLHSCALLLRNAQEDYEKYGFLTFCKPVYTFNPIIVTATLVDWFATRYLFALANKAPAVSLSATPPRVSKTDKSCPHVPHTSKAP